jgi:beta-phosphoglucomutase-like phosphatase (HAD superfamily)
MDGVLINSEPLWRRAMINGFARYGMPITEDECRSTMGMRFREVVALWLEKHQKSVDLVPEVDEAVAALSSLMEPLIMVILGVLIGGLVVAMYLPIFKLGSVV